MSEQRITDFVSIAGPFENQDGEANRSFTLAEWLERDLPKPDYLLGHLLSTTSRVLLFADTGIGKTMCAIAIGMAAGHGTGFLRWQGVRPAKVLFIDGEMSRRLLQERLRDESRRLGGIPSTFHVLSREDCAGMQPLNTPAGQQFVDNEIKRLGGVDFIVFDNIMTLIAGDQKDEEGWRQTLPWALGLTRRKIGMLWVHHTGHDDSRSYGTKTREWQMDTVIHLEKVERPDTDVSFNLHFRKARDRTLTNRKEFEDMQVALVGDEWLFAVNQSNKQKISPLAQKFLEVLVQVATRDEQGDLLAESQVRRMHGFPAAPIDVWRSVCARHGLLSGKNERATFSKYRIELIAANWIACNEETAWVL
jgi:hypothetical protein